MSPVPRPCSAETANGSPSPRFHNAAASISPCGPSTLFATRRTGFFVLRSKRTTCSSVAVAPTVASTTNMSASAMSIAASAACATDRSIPLTLCSQPPVSMRRKSRPAHSARYVTRSRVTPGVSSTTATRRPTMRLTRVDLPTLGRPTIASTGSASCCSPTGPSRARRSSSLSS